MSQKSFEKTTVPFGSMLYQIAPLPCHAEGNVTIANVTIANLYKCKIVIVLLTQHLKRHLIDDIRFDFIAKLIHY